MTECGRCGDCCESIPLSTTKKKLEAKVVGGDPRFDVVWRRWTRQWRSEGTPIVKRRPAFIRDYLDAEFIINHWHGGVANGPGRTKGWTCDAFDPVARLCTAHDARPPICSGYPYYGQDPSTHTYPFDSPRCSFYADIDESLRPDGWVLVEIRTP